jgi:hypothetical protein
VRALARRPRHGIRAAAAATAALLPLAALAQWGGSLTLDSDYRFRGVTLSDSKAAVRLDGNFDSGSGWYAGGAAIQAQLTDSDRYGQLFGYGGYAMPWAGAAAWTSAPTSRISPARAATTSPKPTPECWRSAGACG